MHLLNRLSKREIIGFIFAMSVLLLTPAMTMALDFDGNWNGSWTSVYGTTGSVYGSMYLSGNSVSGMLTITNTDCGTVSLSISGTLINNVLTINGSKYCGGSNNEFRFTQGYFSGSTINGNYNIISDGDLYDSGAFTLVHQPTAPTANFTANTTSGIAPLTVTFTDQSSGTVSTYAWSFGDGQTSTLQNPSHIYPTPGTYTVQLTVNGPGGSNTQTRSGYITVTYPAPVAGFTVDTTTGNAPLQVSFTDQSTGTVSTYAWSFGDGQTSSLQNPSHIYPTPGTYTVQLTVNGPGGSNTQTRSGYITVTYPAPVAGFTVDTTTGNAPLQVSFTDQSTGTVSTYAWSFGDGQTSSLKNPSHIYPTPGTYTVQLTVNGPGGSNTQTRSGYITVTYPAPVAGFTVDTTTGNAPLQVSFTDQSTGTVSTYAWSFGDGQTSTLQNPSHTYQTPGWYTVRLSISGPGGEDTVTKDSLIGAADPLSDLNDDGTVDLADALLGLKILSRSTVSTGLDSLSQKDIDGDNRLGLGETIHILQWLAKLL